MALRLRELGRRDAFALKGGLAAWQQMGLPMEPLIRGDPQTNTVLHQPM